MDALRLMRLEEEFYWMVNGHWLRPMGKGGAGDATEVKGAAHHAPPL